MHAPEFTSQVARSLHAGVTHVVMDPEDTTRRGVLKERIRCRQRQGRSRDAAVWFLQCHMSEMAALPWC